MDRSGKYHTFNGVMISPNLRVFDMKNEVWGNVDPANWNIMEGVRDKHDTIYHPGSKHFDGWYWVMWDNGSRMITNGRRMLASNPHTVDPTPDKTI